VLTDGQTRSWTPADEGRWELFDDLQQQQTVKPRIGVVDVSEGPAGDRTNFSLDTLEVSREFAAVNLPVRVKTTVHYTGGVVPLSRAVHLEVDGQRLANASIRTPQLPPNGKFGVEFEHRFTATGSHVISVVLDSDNLPGDNRADAAVTVADAIPVWLIDGEPHLDRTRSESFFVHAALSSAGNDAPLVKATVVPIENLTAELLVTPQAVALLNVARLTPAQADALLNYVAAGGGLLVAPGELADAANYHALLFGGGDRALPADLKSIETDQAKPPASGVNVIDGSLNLPLVTSLRREHGGGFTEARFAKWWKVELAKVPQNLPPEKAGEPVIPRATEPLVAARLSTQDPLLILRSYGRGRVALLTVPLDSDWSTLPAKSDYVPLMHELVFHLAGGTSPSRNVMVGEPLIMPVAKGTKAEDYLFRDSAKVDQPPRLAGDETRPLLRLDQTDLPGLYQLLPRKEAKAERPQGEQFIVNFDRGESDLRLLTPLERQQLAGKGRLKFIKDMPELMESFYQDAPRTEYWQFLMVLMLCFYIGELVLTRRLILGGHVPGVEPVDNVEVAR